MLGAFAGWPAGPVAHSASMNLNFSLTAAPGRSTLLFQEGVLHLEFAVPAFQFGQFGSLRNLQRRFVFGVRLAIGPNPVSKRGSAHPELVSDRGDRSRSVDNHLGRFLTELG